MNRDERDARREDSLRGVSELAREIGMDPVRSELSGSVLATLAIEQLVKPAISDIVSPVRRKMMARGTKQASKAVTKVVSKKKPSSPTDETNETDKADETDEDSKEG